ncbi:TPA_asm: hypothetical protein [Porphyromonas phage phage029a_Kyudai3]|uniref:Uncharacterized protein n=10 Tax=Viruses TaxID=10239 RepID=A0AAT9J8N5_9CAUD
MLSPLSFRMGAFLWTFAPYQQGIYGTEAKG